MPIRIIIAVAYGMLVASAIVASGSAEAADGRGAYCLWYYQGGADCSFTSLAQCNATASGLAAECDAAAPQAMVQPEAGGSADRAMAAMSLRRRHAIQRD